MTDRYNFRELRTFAIAVATVVAVAQAVSLQADEPASQRSSVAQTSGGAAETNSADGKIPPLDELLSSAIASHPEILAAKAKIIVAEEELRAKQYEISKQILNLRREIAKVDSTIEFTTAAAKNFRKTAESMKAKLAQSTNLSQAEKDTQTAQIDFQEGEAKRYEESLPGIGVQRAQLEKDLQYMTTGEYSVKSQSTRQSAATVKQMPQGSVADKIKTALNGPIEMDFAETPLFSVLDYASERLHIPFMIQTEALRNSGIDPNQTLITFSIQGVPLWGTLQALEDRVAGIQFVVRDYGVLLTTKESADRNGYLSAVQFGKVAQAAAKEKAAK